MRKKKWTLVQPFSPTKSEFASLFALKLPLQLTPTFGMAPAVLEIETGTGGRIILRHLMTTHLRNPASHGVIGPSRGVQLGRDRCLPAGRDNPARCNLGGENRFLASKLVRQTGLDPVGKPHVLLVLPPVPLEERPLVSHNNETAAQSALAISGGADHKGLVGTPERTLFSVLMVDPVRPRPRRGRLSAGVIQKTAEA